jgi:Phosphopantetheine attachment site
MIRSREYWIERVCGALGVDRERVDCPLDSLGIDSLAWIAAITVVEEGSNVIVSEALMQKLEVISVSTLAEVFMESYADESALLGNRQLPDP